MKTKQRKELQTKTEKELQTMLSDAKKQLFSMRLERAQRKLKNTSALLHLRKDIARIKTVIKEKSLVQK